MFENSKWIWQNAAPQKDEYADFYCEFDFEGVAILNISCDSNYAAYIGDTLVAFGQYADFPHDKVYDTVDISDYCLQGKNRLDITVWYYGIETTSVSCKGNAALIFDVRDADGNTLAFSSAATPSRLSPYYKNGYQKIITPQLGYSFLYDSTAGPSPYGESTEASQTLPLRPRPNKKLLLQSTVPGTLISRPCGRYLFDLGSEQVGFLSLDIDSPKPQKLVISYGEHITDGCVRRKIAMRDFSVEYVAKKGRNLYLNPFRRLGARYLEIECESDITVNNIGIDPTVYPLTHKPAPNLHGIHKQIYDACVNTLTLCMHEHYEDCPWREQALYTMDSRNQMLCGYYAFENTEFARSCLELISKDNRPDGLLSICYPKSYGKVIPSFSLHYVTECLEYYTHTGDITLLKQTFPKIRSVLAAFVSRLDDLLPPAFESPDAWNFYEWQKGLDGKNTDLSKKDIILASLLSKALKEADAIATVLGEKTDYKPLFQKINQRINAVFYDERRGVYLDFQDGIGASCLGNSLAILCGAAKGREEQICEKMLSDKTLTPLSLSMLCFKYDALIMTDKEKYKDCILAETERIFRPMLELGGGTVWETESGESDFGGAGSLCHGWSAMPVYYYNIFKE